VSNRERIGNTNDLRQRSPPRGPRPRDIRCHTRKVPYSDAERRRSRCHSAHQRPPRGSSEPARVSDMLGQTDRRRQSAGGPAQSARMPPRSTSTTASAAPLSRSNQDAAPDSGGPGPGLCPEWERAWCARIFRMTAGSCSVAIRRRRPPQWAHASTPMPNARCIRAAQLQARGVAVFTPGPSGPPASGAIEAVDSGPRRRRLPPPRAGRPPGARQ
jgi:hypothetical protein